jgi:PadR family transcriptional regulator
LTSCSLARSVSNVHQDATGRLPLTAAARDRGTTIGGRSSTLAVAIDGRISTTDMAKDLSDRIELLQGTLDMLILRTLLFGPAHGHQIAKHIQRTTEDVLQVEHGSLYPALHRLQRRGWVSSKWEIPKDRNREFKYYRLTSAGKRQLVAEESRWKQLAGAIARVMWPAEEG